MSANSNKQPVAIVTGASSGMGLGIARALLERRYRVVANSRTISKSKDLSLLRTSSWRDGDIGKRRPLPGSLMRL
jgi:NAD(P)-dependent dehydrogenase (short-subunit alcohol dehydrogenase family)